MDAKKRVEKQCAQPWNNRKTGRRITVQKATNCGPRITPISTAIFADYSSQFVSFRGTFPALRCEQAELRSGEVARNPQRFVDALLVARLLRRPAVSRWCFVTCTRSLARSSLRSFTNLPHDLSLPTPCRDPSGKAPSPSGS